MKSLSPENQADIIEALNSTSRYLDDLLNIDNIYFEQMVNRIYPAELQLNKANSSDTEAPFSNFNLFISNGTVSTKIYRQPRKGGDTIFSIISQWGLSVAMDTRVSNQSTSKHYAAFPLFQWYYT